MNSRALIDNNTKTGDFCPAMTAAHPRNRYPHQKEEALQFCTNEATL
jgi:hypothetical protein